MSGNQSPVLVDFNGDGNLDFATENHIGGGSFDELAGSLEPMFHFGRRDGQRLILDPGTGQPGRT